MACCDDCAHKRRSINFTRTILSEKTADKSSYFSFISAGHDVLIPFKALLRRNGKYKDVNYKVGIIGSHGRIGQTIQGVGSMAIPGDFSNLRSPVRSRLYEAATPGGLRIPGIPGSVNKPNRGYRCPEGFQYGGRFTDSRLSTCGQMLFDIPTLGETIRNITAAQGNRRMAVGDATSRELGAVGAVDDVIVRRAAQIPRAGSEDKKKRSQSIASAVTALATSDDRTALLVRADGFTLLPVVSTRVLRTIPDNRNMENGTYVLNIKNPSSIGSEELGLLSNSGINEIVYGLPNGSTIGVRKTRQLTVGERRKLGRTVNSVSSMSTDTDPAARLRSLVAEMGSSMSYFEDFKNIDGPNDMLDARVGKRTIQVRRWAKEAFEGSSRKRITQTMERQAKPSRVTVEKESGLTAAIASLDDNKSPFDIAPEIISSALSKSRAYKAKKAGKRTIYTRGDGKEFIESPAGSDYQHLGERVYSDIANYLGIDAPEVGFVGSGIRRGTLSESPTSAVDGAKPAPDMEPSEVDKGALTRIAALDYLLDVRERDETTLSAYSKANSTGVIAGLTGTAALTGLSSAEIRRREALKLDNFYDARRAVAFREYYRELTDSQRRQMVVAVERLLARARRFSWEDYIARLTVDGKLSDAEKRHLGIVKRIYDTRLDLLSSSRERLVEILSA